MKEKHPSTFGKGSVGFELRAAKTSQTAPRGEGREPGQKPMTQLGLKAAPGLSLVAGK